LIIVPNALRVLEILRVFQKNIFLGNAAENFVHSREKSVDYLLQKGL